MAVPFKNVTVLVEPLEQHKLSDSTLDNIGVGGTAIEVTGFLDYATPEEAYRTFNVELKNPATLDLDLADSTFYPLAPTDKSEWQCHVTGGGPNGGSGFFDGTYWRIVGRPMIYDDGLPLDHAHFLIQQEMYPVTSPAVP